LNGSNCRLSFILFALSTAPNSVRHALAMQHDLQCDADIHRILSGDAVDVLRKMVARAALWNVTIQLARVDERI